MVYERSPSVIDDFERRVMWITETRQTKSRMESLMDWIRIHSLIKIYKNEKCDFVRVRVSWVNYTSALKQSSSKLCWIFEWVNGKAKVNKLKLIGFSFAFAKQSLYRNTHMLHSNGWPKTMVYIGRVPSSTTSHSFGWNRNIAQLMQRQRRANSYFLIFICIMS